MQRLVLATGGDPRQLSGGMRAIDAAVTLQGQMLAGQRAQLQGQLAQTEQMLRQGHDVPIPTAQIEAAWPAQQAQAIEQRLQLAHVYGSVAGAVQYGSPTEIAAARGGIADGSGSAVTLLKALYPDDPAMVSAQRQALLGMFDKEVKARQAALLSDPAQYAAGAPGVAMAAKAVDPQHPDPAALGTYVQALLAAEAHLGVAPDAQHVLTRQQAGALVQRLSGDPSKVDAGAVLDAMKQKYGGAWGHVFGDMVTLGKLRPDYQVLALMSGPDSRQARADLQRAIIAGPNLGKSVALADRKAIEAALPQAVSEFAQSALVPGYSANIGQVAAVRDSITRLAELYVSEGRNGAAAAQDAAKAVLTDHYDFLPADPSTGVVLRVPKGLGPAVSAETTRVQQGLTAAALAPAPGSNMVTAEQRQQILLNAARNRGVWATNRTDSGAVLMVPTRYGLAPVIGADGHPIGVSWAEVRSLPVAPATAAPDLVGPFFGPNAGTGP